MEISQFETTKEKGVKILLTKDEAEHLVSDLKTYKKMRTLFFWNDTNEFYENLKKTLEDSHK